MADDYTVEATGQRLTENMHTLDQTLPTAQEAAVAMYKFANAAQVAWEQVAGNADMWQLRVDGQAYRQTPVFGRFCLYRQFRTWLLRRQLGRKSNHDR